MQIRAILLFALLAAPAPAGPRTSANYNIATDTADAGGKRTTSATYTNDGSAGGIAGLSTIAAPAEIVKHGYAAQLFEVTGLTLAAPSQNVTEGATTALAALLTLDDSTFLAFPAAIVAWSVVSGPLTGVGMTGIATAGIVFADTPATARGIYSDYVATVSLTVLNVNSDDFGAYAADGLDDAWQVQYFGPDNPDAAPGADADHDGFSNKFEYVAGIIPTDPASVFDLRMEPAPGQPGQMRIVFSPRLPGRTYTVKKNSSLLSTPWISLTEATFSDNGVERIVTDPHATEARSFYRVDITRP